MKKNASGGQGKDKLLSSDDISIFCSQIVLILKAGLPLYEGIEAISENVEAESGKKLLFKIQNELEQNSTLYTALKTTGAFPSYMVNMVHIGEKTGRLDSVMEELSLYYARESKLRHRVRSAIFYPMLLVLMMAAVVSLLVIKALPVFNDVILDMGEDISGASQTVMSAGLIIGQYALVIILILAALLLAVLIFSATEAGSRRLVGFAARFGPTRRLSEKIASSRFASLVAMMLASGYDTGEALRLIPDVIRNETVIQKIEKSRQAVEAGKSFAEALDAAQMFPGIYSSMIHTGAKAGRLDSVMNKLADIYSEDVDDTINKAVSLIEPILVAVLSVLIGAILLSVMFPLMGLMSSIG